MLSGFFLGWAIVFWIAALLSYVLGFSGAAATAFYIANVLGVISLSLAALFLGPTALLAQEPPSEKTSVEDVSVALQLPFTVTTDSPFPLRVDGLPTEQLTTIVPPGSQVCVQNPTRYVSLRERWVFQKWSHGPGELCVSPTEPGV